MLKELLFPIDVESNFHYVDIREREYPALVKLIVKLIAGDEISNSSIASVNPFEYHDLSNEGGGMLWKLKRSSSSSSSSPNWKASFPNITYWEERIDSSVLGKCLNTQKLAPSTSRENSNRQSVSQPPDSASILKDSNDIKAYVKTSIGETSEINLSHYVAGHKNSKIPAHTIFLQLQRELTGAPFAIDDWLELNSVTTSGSLIFSHPSVSGNFKIAIEMFKIRDVSSPILEFCSHEINSPLQTFGGIGTEN